MKLDEVLTGPIEAVPAVWERGLRKDDPARAIAELRDEMESLRWRLRWALVLPWPAIAALLLVALR